MIRFQPDTLLAWLMRFFDMAAPDANVYIEIAAPDLRMGALVLLAVAAAILWRRLGARRAPTLAMGLVLLVSSVLWLLTTGNGRYFLPILICAGPIAVGVLCLLPIARRWKALLAGVLVAAQVFVLTQQSPWHQWEWVSWTDAPYFGVELGPGQNAAPATTYATVSSISYSLIAPQFPANSRWISLSNVGATPRDAGIVRAFMRHAAAEGPMRLIVPSLPRATLEDGRPNAAAIGAFNHLISSNNVRISGTCELIPSSGLTRLEGGQAVAHDSRALSVGFWSCPLAYEENGNGVVRQPDPPPQVLAAFRRMGELCPRFFAMDNNDMLRLPDGWVKHYGSDSRVYVMDNGEVWYKFWRSFNPVLVGPVSELAAGKTALNCAAIRGNDRAWGTGAD